MLPEGSHYTDPAAANHFAATRESAAVVECIGVGPTATTFANPANDPRNKAGTAVSSTAEGSS